MSAMSALCQKQTFRPLLDILLVGKGAQVRGASPMKLPRRTFLHLAAGAAALPEVLRNAWAQAYPTRPVRVLFGQAAGSGSDTVRPRLTVRLCFKDCLTE